MKPGTVALATLPLFAKFSASQIASLNDISDVARVGPDETLYRQGDRLDALHILLAGTIAETHADAYENALTDIISPIAPIGFAQSILGAVSATGAKTITFARLIIIPAPELRTIIRAKPALSLPFFEYALARMCEQTLDICHLKRQSSVQRLAGFLLGLIEDPESSPVRLALPYDKRFIAVKIGCSKENLSRAFAALRSVGVQTQKGVVVVNDVPRLRAFARLAPVAYTNFAPRSPSPGEP